MNLLILTKDANDVLTLRGSYDPAKDPGLIKFLADYGRLMQQGERVVVAKVVGESSGQTTPPSA